MSKKACDGKNRWRSKTIAFRISPEENRILEARVKLSGLTKQDYIIRRCLEKDILVYGNSRVYKALSEQVQALNNQLIHVLSGGNLPPDFAELLEAAIVVLHGLGADGQTKAASLQEIMGQGTRNMKPHEERHQGCSEREVK